MKKGLLDTSSAILLFKTDMAEQLIKAYWLIISTGVYEELTCPGMPGAHYFRQCCSKHDIAVRHCPPFDRHSMQRNTPGRLDRGEAELLACFTEGLGDFVITDDGSAAKFCRQQGIPFINALLFPRILNFCGMLPADRCQQKMNELVAIGRYSQKIIDYAISCAAADLAPFQIQSPPGK